MAIHLGAVAANSTIYIPFASYDAAGASATLSGLATTDIEVYKNGSATARASDNGYALLDTDGIDFNAKTGINGFSIDLSDNSDASFYSVGGFYWVVVASVTIATQTVNLVAATFTITDAIDLSDVQSHLTKVYSDTTIITSDLAEVDTSDIRSAITVANSQILIIKSDVSDVLSRVVVINSETTDIQSETEVIQSQVLILKSDTSDIQSHLTVWDGAGGILSDINSGVNAIQAAGGALTAGQDSKLTQIHSDTQPVGTMFEIISDIYSDTTAIEGTVGGGEGDISDVLSRLTVTNSQLLIVKSDTSDIISTLVKVYSDTTAIHSDTNLATPALVADAVWDEATSGHVTAGTFGQTLYIARANTAAGNGGGTATIELDASASATNDFYNGHMIVLTGGTGLSQAKFITDYVGATKIATVAEDWLTTPDATSVFVIIPFPNSEGGDISDVLSRLTVTNSQVLIIKSDTSDIKSHLTAIATVTSDIQSDTNLLITRIGEGDWSDVLSRLTVTNSQLVVVKSDVAHTESDAARVESKAVQIYSDTTIIASDAAQLTFTQAGVVDANIQYVNDVAVTGTGANGDEWGPV
jgi:hypothetical protein